LLFAALLVFIAYRARTALHATLPPDMPASSRFVATGYDIADNESLGLWIACRPDLQQPSDWCRVTDQRGTVVFEGQFLPVDSPQPVPAAKLVIAPVDKATLWTSGPAEQSPVPVIPLEDGQRLVPAADRLAFLTRWADHPEESKKYLQSRN
jgi:hypothetical protein